MSERKPQARHIRKRVGRNVFDAPPKISVVITAYNDAAHIRAAIDSVVGQKYREHEIIIVNDGSPDTESLERAIKMRMEDVTYIRQRNAGKAVALNTGIEHARGQIVAFLDAADIWQPDFLASQYVFLERNVYDMVYCDSSVFGMHSAYRKTFMETLPSEGEANFDGLLDRRCNVLMSGTMVRKGAIIDAGFFEAGLNGAFDLNMWLRMARNGARIGYQQKQLVKSRARLDGFTGDVVTCADDELEALRRIRGIPDLSERQRQLVDRRVNILEADLAEEQGMAFLSSGEYREAALAFRVANGHRRSFRLAAVGWFTRIAPRTVLKFYKSKTPSANAYATRHT
jgi:glycosyltransferase involved in cell wall biosynthesis